MGVTAHFFAFDPERCPGVPTMDRLLEWGALDEAMEVQGPAKAWLVEVPSPLGDNKKWYANLAGDHAWSVARGHVDADVRGTIDRWLSHLFWCAGEGEEASVEDSGCLCGESPVVVAEDELVYDAALIEHILGLECSLAPAEAALACSFGGDQPRNPRFDRPWIYDYDGFCWLVWAWQETLERARQSGAGWSLLRWVWV